jgi:hypothetical protein
MRRLGFLALAFLPVVWAARPGLAQPGNIILASVSDSGMKGNSVSFSPTASADGTKVAFVSAATNLDPADTDRVVDIYVKDLVTGDISLASTSDSGAKGNKDSSDPSLSADGTKVAFWSSSTTLDPNDTDVTEDVYVKDLASGDIVLASTSDTERKGNGDSNRPALSADGSFVAFHSAATNLDPGDPDSQRDVYVKDLSSGDIVLASTSDLGVKGNIDSADASISADGSRTAFHSAATNLDVADADSDEDVYVKDLASGDIVLASTSDVGVKGNNHSGDFHHPGLSADGSIVAFHSIATNLDPADTDLIQDAYVKNLMSGDIMLVSTSDSQRKGAYDSLDPDLSGDGTRVAFWSTAENLDPADLDGFADVYVKDLTSGDLTLASTSDEGLKGNDWSWGLALSDDGSAVAFHSLASNLDPADPDEGHDVYVKELGPPGSPPITARGHAHTDYSGDGEPGNGDVHVATRVVSDGSSPPAGQVRYADLRADPPGQQAEAFDCRGIPTAVDELGADSAQIEGKLACRGLNRAATFALVLADGGSNPPYQDRFLIVLYDASGRVLYDWGDLTTIGLGDLTVRTG